jgi:hypothetical protein
MKLTLLILSLFIVTGSLFVSTTAWAKDDPQSDYCSSRLDGCYGGCAQYNFHIVGMNFPSPRSVACGLECSVAYAGCLMMRFREGV